MTIITLHHLFFGHCVNSSVIVLDLGIFLRELRSLRKIPRSKTITSDFTIDIEYNKRLDRQRPYLEDELNRGSNNTV